MRYGGEKIWMWVVGMVILVGRDGGWFLSFLLWEVVGWLVVEFARVYFRFLRRAPGTGARG